MNEISEILRRELPGLREGVALAPLCAYGVGGPAQFLFEARTTDELARAATTAGELRVPLTVLGRATNVLIADAGLRGLTVLARNEARSLDGETLEVGAGAELPGLVAELARQGLAGLEFAGNIPGSVGGAVVGNAGAYGRDVSGVLASASLQEDGRRRSAAPAELEFGYRSSALKTRAGVIVLAATFVLHAGAPGALLEEIARDAELRRSKHPLEYASCGSFFKNPSRELPAARYIEDAGLKGFRLGGAQVSEKHANFLVALRGAAATDIVALAAEVRRRVREQSGVDYWSKRCGGWASTHPEPATAPEGLRGAGLRLTRRPPRYTCRVRRGEPRPPRGRRLSYLEEGHRGVAPGPGRPAASRAAGGACRVLSPVRTAGEAHPLPPGVLRGGRRCRAGSVHQGLSRRRRATRRGLPRLVLPHHPQHRPRSRTPAQDAPRTSWTSCST